MENVSRPSCVLYFAFDGEYEHYKDDFIFEEPPSASKIQIPKNVQNYYFGSENIPKKLTNDISV